ncbi:MAG: hypothetical protein E8A46_02495 [Bradyrhizobium sp.]|nr:MAG: hypothetical protein E8A46_02495 [Bradyrhizobium sp.]
MCDEFLRVRPFLKPPSLHGRGHLQRSVRNHERLTRRFVKVLVEDQDRLLDQKKVLAEELQHRVRNNLQLVYGMLSKQLDDTADKAGQRGIKAIARRVSTLAQVYDHLLGAEMTRTSDFGSYVKSLCLHLAEIQEAPEGIGLGGEPIMLLSSNKRERHTPGHGRLPDGFDRAGPGWSLNFRFAAQYCSVWQIKPGLAPDFRTPGPIVASVYWIHGNPTGLCKKLRMGSVDYGHRTMARSGGEIRQPW